MRREYAKTLGCAALLFALNAAITPMLFHTAYTAQMGSIEAAFIGLARYVSEHWHDLGWFPLWYGGIPYPDSYPPLLHWIDALAIGWTGASPGLAYHFVTAAIYCLGPVALFWLAWRLSGKRECALLAAFGYSLISPTCVLVKSARLDADGLFGPRRLVTLVVWGEGPHLTSLCLLPLAIGMLHVALAKRRPWWWVAAALAIAAVPMSNWLGGMALAIGVTAYLFAGLPAGRKLAPTLLCTGALGLYAYAIAVPWLSPSTVAVIRANAPRVADNFKSDATHRLFLLAVVAAFLLAAWAMARFNVSRHTRFAWLMSIVFAASNLGRLWFKLSLLPQPDRYGLEMDMFLWLAVVFAIWPLVHRAFWPWRLRFPRTLQATTVRRCERITEIAGLTGESACPTLVRKRLRLGGAGAFACQPALSQLLGERLLPRAPALAIALVLVVAAIPIIKRDRRSSRWMERPIDIRTTIEYKTAKWLDAHMPGQRVFAPGTIGFWLNAFSDAPQITGGFDNGISNPTVEDVIFHVYVGDRQEYIMALLRAYGCDALIGGGKDSAEYYHPISHVEKLRGLKELWRDGGDAVYNVPQRSRSLAHVVGRDEVTMRPLVSYGFSALDPYLAALDNPAYPIAAFRWRAPSAATVTTDMRPGQVLSVQVSWDKGWNASVAGRQVPVWSDKLGQMVVEPECHGPCTVELIYTGGAEAAYARAVHSLALAGGALWILGTILWQIRSGSTKTN